MLIGEPTSFTAPSYGLLSTATELNLTGNHWKLGVVWEPLCPDVAGTYDPCLSELTPDPKAPTFDSVIQGATPFTAYARVDCSPVGMWDELPVYGRNALLRAEEQFVENVFWTGVIDGSAATVLPHLAENTAVADGQDLMQPAATIVTATPQPFQVGIGMLEQAARDCYPGQATLHAPLRLGSLFANHTNIVTRGSTAQTVIGSQIVLGAGYPGTSPAGVSTPGVSWVYATGPVFFQRDNVIQFSREESLDRSVNTLSIITERTYVVGFSCCLLAIPILNGELP